MKKKICIILLIVVFIVLLFAVITNYADSARVTTGNEPRFCIKIISPDGSKVTYIGLGYKVVRYVGVSPNEPFKCNVGVKMGSWFMNYEKPEVKTIKIANIYSVFGDDEGEYFNITDINDVSIMQNILENSKYNGELCKGINTYSIIMDNETYYLKKVCKELQKGDKQAELTDEDLSAMLEIIEKYERVLNAD